MPVHGVEEFEGVDVSLCVQQEGREADVEGENQQWGIRSKSCGGSSGSSGRKRGVI